MPVVVDVETAGFNAQTDALLEIAAIPIVYNEDGQFVPGEAYHAHINPFEGANLDRRSLNLSGLTRQIQCGSRWLKMKNRVETYF